MARSPIEKATLDRRPTYRPEVDDSDPEQQAYDKALLSGKIKLDTQVMQRIMAEKKAAKK